MKEPDDFICHDSYENRLKELDVNLFAALHNLELLYLYGNQLEVLPQGLFRANTKLTRIYLQDNNIKKIESDFHNILSLVKLDLRGNVCMNEECDVMKLCDTSSIIEKIRRNCSN